MRINILLIVSIFLFGFPLSCVAEDAPPPVPQVEGLLASFEPQMGLVELPNGVAQLEVPEEFRYIGPADAQKFLEQGWGNPDGSGTLGMLLPTETDPFSGEGWGVVITYQEDGHVEDKDAAQIDYDELLASMQQAEKEINEERRKNGYTAVNLVGWAEKPHYDAASKKLYWAKELKFEDNLENTLNYNVRVLGRKGVLVLNAVAGMSQLPAIKDRMKQVLAFSEFRQGHRYADFDSGVDKVAAYGIAALIGGKVAAKVGLLAKLGVVLVAMKKFIIVGLAAIGGALAKFFKRSKGKAPVPSDPQ